MRQDSGATSLELDQDAQAQAGEWRFERIGWVAIGLVLAAGLSGLFGDGPLSAVVERSPDGQAAVRYERVAHFGTTNRLSLMMPAGRPDDSVVVVTIDRDFLNGAEVERTLPQTESMRTSQQAVEFRFARVAGEHAVRVDFSLTPTTLGVRHGRIGTSSGVIAIRQFVLP